MTRGTTQPTRTPRDVLRLKVLVAVDGSQESDRAAAFVARLVPAGSHVRLLVVAGETNYHPPAHENGDPAGEDARRAALAALVEDATSVANVALVAAGHDVSVTQRFGYAQDEILALVDEWRPDLIVLGHRRLSGLAKWMDGVSERVLRHAKTPVLFVP